MSSTPTRRPGHTSLRRGRGPRLRADLRLAWRQLLRNRGSSLLVILLIVLPVAGLSAAAIFWKSHVPTLGQAADLQLGRTQVWIEAVGAPDPQRRQAVDQPYEWGTIDGSVPAGNGDERPSGPPPGLPADADVRELTRWGSLLVDTPYGALRTLSTSGDAWDPVFTGKYRVLDGTLPSAADQAMASPGLLHRLGLQVGDRIVLSTSGRSFTVTGTMRRADAASEEPELFVGGGLADETGGQRTWYVTNWQPDLSALDALNRAGYIAYARDLVSSPPAGAHLSATRSGAERDTGALLVGLGAAVFSGYLVVLLAGAAFAVSARRQQRALAMISSVGGGRADVFRIVLFQGSVIGAVAGVLGVAMGAGLAALALAVTDRGVTNSFWGNWGYQVPWPLLAAVSGFAVIVGTLAALAPARNATRGDVLTALRGGARPAPTGRRSPAWGFALSAIGLLSTAGGGLLLAATMGGDQETARVVAVSSLVGGPVVFQLGFLMTGRWVLGAVTRMLAHVGTSARIAARDAAANASRIVPAFAAITGCVFLATFALGATALVSAQNTRSYSYVAPPGSLLLSMSQNGSAASGDLVEAAARLAASTSPSATALLSGAAEPAYEAGGSRPIDPESPVYAIAEQPSPRCRECGGPATAMNLSLWIASADDIDTLLGTPVDPDLLRSYRQGDVAIATDASAVTSDGDLVITQWTVSDRAEFSGATPHRTAGSDGTADAVPRPRAEHRVPAVLVDTGLRHQIQAIISPRTAERLGISSDPLEMVALYDAPLDDATLDRLTQEAESLSLPDDAHLSPWREQGPGPVEPWMWLIVGVAMVLVVGVSAVCLGLARYERRPDDSTLAAIGGTVALRRSINGWQALVVVAIGSIVGSITGLVPVWGAALSSSDGFRPGDLPWPWLGVLAIALPVAIAVIAWLIPPPKPDISRRTAIA